MSTLCVDRLFYFDNKMNQYVFAVVAGIEAALAIALALAQTVADVALIMAPFGATAVLVFGVPTSPLAQPRNDWQPFALR